MVNIPRSLSQVRENVYTSTESTCIETTGKPCHYSSAGSDAGLFTAKETRDVTRVFLVFFFFNFRTRKTAKHLLNSQLYPLWISSRG